MVTCPSFHGYFALANIFLTFPDLTRHFFSYQREQQTPCKRHPRKVDHQAKTVLFFFTSYGPTDRQQSGRVVCQDRIYPLGHWA